MAKRVRGRWTLQSEAGCFCIVSAGGAYHLLLDDRHLGDFNLPGTAALELSSRRVGPPDLRASIPADLRHWTFQPLRDAAPSSRAPKVRAPTGYHRSVARWGGVEGRVESATVLSERLEEHARAAEALLEQCLQRRHEAPSRAELIRRSTLESVEQSVASIRSCYELALRQGW